jgi:hypothetical protein
MKKFTILVTMLGFVLSTFAQTVKVKKDEARIKGENLSGYAVDLDGKSEEVTISLTKYFKSLGKARQNDGFIALTESTINGVAYKSPVYGVIKENGSTTTAWMGEKKEEWTDGGENISKEIEKIVYEFGVKFYRDKIQLQIDESLRAFQAVEKQQQRLITQQRDLNMRLEDNKREKIQLEQSIENNKLQHEILLLKIENNKKAQDSMVVVNEQVKKVVEGNREKQKRVN